MSYLDVSPEVKEKRVKRSQKRIEALTQSARRARDVMESRLEQIKLEKEIINTLQGYVD